MFVVYLIETRFLRIYISLRILAFRNLYVLTLSKTLFRFKWSPSCKTRVCLLLQCTIYISVKWKVWGHLLWWHHPFIVMLAYLNTGKCKSKAGQNVHQWRVTKHFILLTLCHKKVFDSKNPKKAFTWPQASRLYLCLTPRVLDMKYSLFFFLCPCVSCLWIQVHSPMKIRGQLVAISSLFTMHPVHRTRVARQLALTPRVFSVCSLLHLYRRKRP